MIKYSSYNESIYDLIENSKSVLDIGCATGRLIQRLKHEKGCDVVGIESNEEAVKEATKDGLDVLCLDLEEKGELPIFHKFDYIVFADVLEHLSNPAEVLKRYAKLLVNGGKIVVSLPNIAFLLYRLKIFLGNFDYAHYGVMDESHLRFFTLKTGDKLLTENGFRIISVHGYNGNIKPVYYLLKPLGRLFPSLFATDVVYVAQKNE